MKMAYLQFLVLIFFKYLCLLVLCLRLTWHEKFDFSLQYKLWTLGIQRNYTIRRHRCAISFSLRQPFLFQPERNLCVSCSASANMPPPFVLQYEHIWRGSMKHMCGHSGVSLLPLIAAEAYNVIYGAGAHFSNSIMNFDYWWKFETGNRFDRKLKPRETRRILVGVHESSGCTQTEQKSAQSRSFNKSEQQMIKSFPLLLILSVLASPSLHSLTFSRAVARVQTHTHTRVHKIHL